MNQDDYLNILIAQDNKCAICKGSNGSTVRSHYSLAVDHNHKTGHVRGLLCMRCNLQVGMIETIDPQRLNSIMHYLQNNKWPYYAKQ